MFKKTNKELSVKWGIFTCFLTFSLIMIFLLWLFQIVLLDDFYRTIKTKELFSTADTIEKSINSDFLDTTIEGISNRRDICIMLYREPAELIYSSEVQMNCIIHKIPSSILYSLSEKSLGDKNHYFEQFTPDGNQKSYFTANKKREIPNSSLLVKRFVDANDNSYILILNSVIEPVVSTTTTLRSQLSCITIIMLVLSFILSLAISKKISKPIVNINNSAKKLSTEYNIKFNDSGYTEISELANTLTKASSELSKVENLRRELIANVSHDLRTPLTMITGYAEVMKDIPGENTPENIQIIIDEAKRLTSLVNDVVEMSKNQNSVQELHLDDFNLTECISKILERYTKLTENDGYKIIFEKDKDVFVNADNLKITQVIYNLINNALTYTGDDKVVKIVQTVNDGKVKIEIKDTGDGINPDEIDYVWDRYYKAKGNHKRAQVGTGLGLAIVKGVLELHKANFGVKNDEGGGANFWFELKTL